MSRYTQGVYKVKNKAKYKGDVNNVIYRSSWELKYMFQLDNDENVLEWSSEEVIIPYVTADNKVHRYFTDFKVKRKSGEQIITEIIEIKPYKETIPPVLTEGKKTKTKIREVLTWDVNQRKWAAARKYCEKMGWRFVIVTEKNIPGLIKRL